MVKSWSAAVLALTMFGAANPALMACEDLDVSNAWLRRPPPGREVAAGYFRLRNIGDLPVSVVAVESDDFDHVMLHETRYENGRAMMRAKPVLTLAAGSELEARPGGLHLMTHGPIPDADAVVIRFVCAEGAPRTVRLPLRRAAPE